MKRYAYLLAAAAAALALNISCTGPENPAQPEATLKAEPASLRFAAAAAPAQTVTVTAEETEWTHSIPEDAGWLTATRDGDRLSVSVADNADETDRSASITLNASAEGVEPVKITVRQEAAEAPEPEKPSLSVSPEKLVFAAAEASGQEVTVTVTGGITWKASPSGAEEWIHIVPAEGKFTVTVDDNPNALERKASINVSPSDKTVQTGRIYVTQEAAAVPPSIEPVLPDGATPEEGLELPFTAGVVKFAVKAAPETAQWSAYARDENNQAPDWLTVHAVVAPEQHSIILEYKINDATETRTAYLFLQHESEETEPVRVTITQKGKSDVNSTIYEDVETGPMLYSRVEVMANNDWRDYPFVQWTLTLYTDGLTYNKLWGRWDGSGERMRILLLGSPQHEDDVTLEEMTYEIVPYDEYNKEPLTDRKPGWACGSRGDGKTVVYPAGTWYQVIEAGKATQWASAESGTITVSKNGDDYTVSWDLTSDAGCKVTGSYTGPIDIILLIDSREGARYRGSLPAVSEMSGRLLTRRCRPREKAGDHKTSDRGTCYRPSRPAPARYSAICTAFSAAPFRIWSATHQKVSPLGLAVSIRIRPTYTGYLPAVKSGMGYSCRAGSSMTTMPSKLPKARRASSGATGRSVSTHTLSEWARMTGTRTHMALTATSECIIFLVSLTIFISSFVYPLSVNTSICGMRLPTSWKANLSTRGGRPAAISAYCPSSSAIAPAPAPLAA